MNEQELDELLRVQDEKENTTQLKRKLRKSVNKQIYSRILLTLLVIALIGGGGIWARNVYLEKTSYNPLQEDEMMYFEDEGSGFAYLLELYFNMLNGGGIIWDVYYDQNEGSGQYRYDYRATPFFDTAEGWKYGFNKSMGSWGWITVSNSQLHMVEEINGTSHHSVHQQNRELETSMSSNSLQTVYQEVQRLPETCLFDVSIYFHEKKNMDEIADFIVRHPNFIYSWMARETDEQLTFTTGMSLAGLHQRRNSDSFSMLKTTVLDEYPSLALYQSTKINGEVLTEHYLSTLKLLLDHKDFMKVIDSSYDVNTTAELQQDYDEVLADGLYSKGLRCIVSQPELLALIESGEIEFACVYDLKLSYLQK